MVVELAGMNCQVFGHNIPTAPIILVTCCIPCFLFLTPTKNRKTNTEGILEAVLSGN